MPKKNRGSFLEWRAERNVWEIIWYEAGQRKRRSTGCSDRTQADKVLTEHKERAHKRTTSRLVDDVLADYQEEHAPHTSRPQDIAHCVLNLSPFFGDMAVEEVSKAKCQEYARRRKTKLMPDGIQKTLSDASIRKDLEILRAALNHDHAEGRCPATFYVWMPQKPEARERWLTRKEAADLLRAAKKQKYSAWYLRWFILLSLYSGQRRDAVLKLTWDRVDLERGTINWQYGKKTNKRRPRQPMSDALWSFMRYLQSYGNHYVLHRNGEVLGRVNKGLGVAYSEAKIKDASPHTLKHTAITWMLQSGADMWAVAGFTGTSLKTIESTYGHHAPGYLEAARNASKMSRERRVTVPDTAPKKATQNDDV